MSRLHQDCRAAGGSTGHGPGICEQACAMSAAAGDFVRGRWRVRQSAEPMVQDCVRWCNMAAATAMASSVLRCRMVAGKGACSWGA